jgi:hypothetical protein
MVLRMCALQNVNRNSVGLKKQIALLRKLNPDLMTTKYKIIAYFSSCVQVYHSQQNFSTKQYSFLIFPQACDNLFPQFRKLQKEFKTCALIVLLHYPEFCFVTFDLRSKANCFFKPTEFLSTFRSVHIQRISVHQELCLYEYEVGWIFPMDILLEPFESKYHSL